MGPEIDRGKSATNSVACTDTAVLLEGAQGYKYVGAMEDSTSEPIRESYDRIRTETLA
ncbi:hypothetical protein PAEPH01_1586 [Pancytospora epiphaga]|nr:hypothetical protein PAEPH01_1586 [Pancytospora epiphaga]